MRELRGPIRADEAIRQLEADPEWVARCDAQAQERAERAQELRAEQQTLVAELRGVGLDVNGVWDLVNTSQPYPDALPILLHHFFLPYADRTREGIARALAVKDARPLAWDQLLAALESGTLGDGVAEGAMIALSVMARPADLEIICNLIRNPALGPKRVFLVRNLTRSKKAEAKATLLAVQSDPDLSVEINRWLKSRKN